MKYILLWSAYKSATFMTNLCWNIVQLCTNNTHITDSTMVLQLALPVVFLSFIAIEDGQLEIPSIC